MKSFASPPTTPTTPFRSNLYNDVDIDGIATWRYGDIASPSYAGIVLWGGMLGGGENRLLLSERELESANRAS